MTIAYREYQDMINTFRIHPEWHYYAPLCENQLCCGDNPENPTIHGMVLWGDQYSPMIICEDCFHQITIKTYSKREY